MTHVQSCLVSLSLLACCSAVTTEVHGDTVGFFDISCSNGFNEEVNVVGVDVGGNQSLYTYQTAQPDFLINSMLLGNSVNPFLGGSVQLTNNTLADDLNFQVNFAFPTNEFTTALSLWDASATIVIAGLNPSIQSLPGEPVWSAAIEGELLGTMFVNPFNLSLSGEGTAAIDEALSGTTPFNGGELGLRLSFTLSPGDTVAFGTSVGFIPTPGAIAVLGLSLVSGRSRRRRVTNGTT